MLATGRRFSTYTATYRCNRGMGFECDVHNWLGGWPYESILPSKVAVMMKELGFAEERVFARDGIVFGRNTAFFGSGYDEFVYRRKRASGRCAA